MHIRNVSDLDAYDTLPVRDRQRAWDELMSSDDRKRMLELRAFLGFAEASDLPVDRATAVCLDPPSPDIRCSLGSSRYFFELGEVADERLARRYSESLRTGETTGGWHSQAEPLASILTGKMQKTYQTDGAPADLLLYYWKQVPFYSVVQRVVSGLKPVIDQILCSGPFSTIWIYEHPGKVLYVFPRSVGLASRRTEARAR